MTQEKDSNDKFSGLRSQAEKLLGPVSVDQEDISALSPDEIQGLAQDLRVHQIELEMQNEDLRHAQIKLEELKDRYLDLYDFAPVGYVALNDKGLILEANLTAVRLLGVERTSLIKMFFSHFVCQEFMNAYFSYLKQIFESQSKQTCEINLTRKDGTVFYAQLESIPVQDESGQFNRCRTVLSDITDRKLVEEELKRARDELEARVKERTTKLLKANEKLQVEIAERKQAEDALKAEKQRFQSLGENSPFGMVMIQPDGTFSYANPKFKEMFGYDLNDVPNGREWFRKAYPDPYYRHEVISSWMEHVKSSAPGETTPRVFRVTCKDGSDKIVHFRPVKLDSDEDMMTCEDITELKQAEETLKEREQMLRTILSISPVGIGLTQDRVMKWVNEHPCPVRAQPTMRIRFRSESWHTT